MLNKCIDYNLNNVSLPIRFYTDKNYNHERRLRLILLGDTLNTSSEFQEKKYHDKIQIIENIEHSFIYKTEEMYKEHSSVLIKWDKIYTNIYYDVSYGAIANMNPESVVQSNHLINLINLNQIDLLAFANDYGNILKSIKYKNNIDTIAIRKNVKIKVNYTEMFRCRKCKSTKHVQEQARVRLGGDEGMGLRIFCVNCNASRMT